MEILDDTLCGTYPTLDTAAQFAADQDNYCSAFARTKTALPLATLTKEALQNIKKLYPDRLPPHIDPRQQTRLHSTPPTFDLSDEATVAALRRVKKATAAGPYADPVDLARGHALHAPQTDPTKHTEGKDMSRFVYLPTFKRLLRILLAGDLPPTITEAFAAQYFFALHKDPNDPDKLRPIGIGTAYRRLLGVVIMAHLKAAFATYLLPFGQFGIGIKGGINFILHSTLAQLQCYVAPEDGTIPTRALVLLDLKNMFNECSRKTCRHTLATTQAFAAAVPAFNLLYKTPNKCWYINPNNTYDSFQQCKGFAQGCPLSPVFASLVLAVAFKPIIKQLKIRAAKRAKTALPHTSKGDDGRGSASLPLSYFDDTTATPPYIDIPFLLKKIQTLGPPHGITLNLGKTKILTATNGILPLPRLPTEAAQALQEAFDFLNPKKEQDKSPEILHGMEFLGQPIGSTQACKPSRRTSQTPKHNQHSSATVLNRQLNTSTQATYTTTTPYPKTARHHNPHQHQT